ncbi:MAG: hypothetical protein IT383_21745 [Deltaproteobacteria bacterium]|nr:hypothetical protein [Deltaproteobacteria bacterium]
MSKAGRRRTAEEWSRLLRELERSGQTPEIFARARGIRVGTLKWWRWRLAGGPKSSSVPARTKRVQLIAIRPVPDSATPERSAATPVWELVAPTGHELRVYDPRGLGVLKAALFAVAGGRRR